MESFVAEEGGDEELWLLKRPIEIRHFHRVFGVGTVWVDRFDKPL